MCRYPVDALNALLSSSDTQNTFLLAVFANGYYYCNIKPDDLKVVDSSGLTESGTFNTFEDEGVSWDVKVLTVPR